MTVMVDRFFGIHPYVIRSGLWRKMKPGEHSLYVFLMAKSERHCTRELICTDAEIAESVGVKPRTLCNARKKLQEFGLIVCTRVGGNKYKYVICDPTNGQPYPGSPKERIRYKQSVSQGSSQPHEDSLERHGLRGVFD